MELWELKLGITVALSLSGYTLYEVIKLDKKKAEISQMITFFKIGLMASVETKEGYLREDYARLLNSRFDMSDKSGRAKDAETNRLLELIAKKVGLTRDGNKESSV